MNQDLIKKLKSTSFHILQAPDPFRPSNAQIESSKLRTVVESIRNPSGDQLELSAIYVRQIGPDIFVFDKATDANPKVQQRIALPLSAIKGLLPLPTNELTDVRHAGPRVKQPNKPLEPLPDYFQRAVVPFLTRGEGIEHMWQENQEAGE